MSEAFPGESSHHAEVDIELDIVPQEAGPVVSVQEGRQVPKTNEEKISAEGLLVHEYANKGAIFMRLAEGVEGVKMPDLKRISVLMPQQIRPAIDEAVSSLMMLSLYRGTNQAIVREEVERVIRENRFEQVIAEQNKLVLDARARVARLQEQQKVEADAARAATNDIVAAEQLLTRMRQEMEQGGKMTPMPVVAASEPRAGWLGKIKGMFS